MKNLLLVPFICILFFSCGPSNESASKEAESTTTKEAEELKPRGKKRKGGSNKDSKKKAAKKKGRKGKKGKGAAGDTPNTPLAYTQWGDAFTDEEVNDFILQNEENECFEDILGTIDLKAATQITDCDWRYTLKTCKLPQAYAMKDYEDVIYTDQSTADGNHQYEFWAIFEGKYNLESVEIKKFRNTCIKNSGAYALVLSAEEDETSAHNALIIGMAMKVSDVPNEGKGIVFRFENEKKKSRKLFVGTIVKSQ